MSAERVPSVDLASNLERSTGSGRIREAGWRQGSIVAPGDLAMLHRAKQLDPDPGVDSCGVVVTQDCDLLHPDYEAEAHAELLVGRPVANADARYEKLRNPRVLHVPFRAGNRGRVLELRAAQRALVPRRVLEAIAPDEGRVLGPRELSLVIDWLTHRYTRTAFPDAFNVRRRKANKRLERIMERHGENVEAVYLQLSSERELPDGEPYNVSVYVVMRTERYAERPVRVRIEREFAAAFAEALDQCDGIAALDYDVRPESKFSLDDLRVTLRFDTESFSVAA